MDRETRVSPRLSEFVRRIALTGGEPMGRSTSLPQSELPQRRWVKQEFVAEYLGITKRTVREMTADGRLRAYRINPRFVRYDLNEVDAAFTPYGGSVTT